jgi:thiol:disulfide interchange protein DsbC
MSSLIAALSLAALLPSAANAQDATVEERLASMFPGVEAENISATPVPGLWEVAVAGQVIYLSEDGRYMVRGDIIDMMADRNLTEDRRNAWTEQQLAKVSERLDESSMVVFAPKGETRHTVTVLTDVDCTYCRRLHRELEAYHAQGIKIRYMFYPLGGEGSPGWTKAEAVWCSPDRNDAMTRAKLGQPVSAKPCDDTPVQAHYDIGRELGISGTPAILTDKGVARGYVPADRLAAWLDAE